jgi:hypothetical protein
MATGKLMVGEGKPKVEKALWRCDERPLVPFQWLRKTEVVY